jgi:uncharacterized protein involved in outer membrane biogenesis
MTERSKGKSRMRKALIIIGGVIVLVVVAVVIVVANLGAIVNRNKDFLLARAESTLGRKVSIENIGVTLRGGIGVRLENVSVADDSAFSSEPFLTARELQVNAKLLPLLKKRFEIKRVVLREPFIHVIRDEEGRLNTTTIGASKTQAGGAGAPADNVGSGVSGAAAPLVISLVNIDGGELRMSDRRAGLDLRLTQLESKVEELDFDKPIALSLQAAFLADEPNIKLTGRFGPVGQPVDVANLAVQATLDVEPIDVGKLAAALPALGKAMPKGVAIEGPVTAQLVATGRPDSVDLELRVDATHTAVRVPKSFEKAPGIPLVITSDVRVTPPNIVIERFTLGFHTLEASGSGTYTLTTPPTLNLTVESKSIALADWAEMVPAMKPYGLSGTAALSARIDGALSPGSRPNTKGTLTITHAGAKVAQLPKPVSQAGAEIAFSGTQAKVTNISATIGGSTVEGSATVESFTPLAVAYEARSASLALDDVRPPNPKAKTPEVFRDITVVGRMIARAEPENHGELTAASGSLANLDMKNLKASYALVGKEARFDTFEVQTLDGTIAGSGVVDMKGEVPKFDFKTDVRNVNVLAFLDRLPSVTTKFLRGRASLDLDVSGAGKEWPDIQKSISGNGLAQLFDGALVDFNILGNVVDQLSSLTGNSNLISNAVKDKYPKLFKSPDTEFKDLHSDFVVENGKLLARNLSLKADEYDIAAKGAVGLDKSLDVSVNLLLSKTLSSDLIKDVKLAGYLANASGQIEIPFMLEGTLPKARAKIDGAYVNKVVQKALVQQGLDALQKQDVGNDIKDLFNKLGTKKKSAPADTTKKP